MMLIVHGGAGSVKPAREAMEKLSESLVAGNKILRSGGSALDAVTISISVLEDSGYFNAGSGGNLQLDGVRRLDASLMDGRYLRAGSVAGVEEIRNPIKLARIVMDLPHVMFTNVGAQKIAQAHNLEMLPEPNKEALRKLEEIKKMKNKISRIYTKYFSTVGAVALDSYGNVAAGSSTGGLRAMLPGRVGDTPVIGAGVYAENPLGAVACTGTGEHIIRLSLAKEICMNLKTMSPLRAALLSLRKILKIEGNAGVIVINKKGRTAIVHTTKYMASGYFSEKGVALRQRFKITVL